MPQPSADFARAAYPRACGQAGQTRSDAKHPQAVIDLVNRTSGHAWHVRTTARSCFAIRRSCQVARSGGALSRRISRPATWRSWPARTLPAVRQFGWHSAGGGEPLVACVLPTRHARVLPQFLQCGTQL